MASPLDIFFNLGNKATKNDPFRKAKFDYYLYWIVFLAFVGIAITYYYSFFMKGSSISTLFWGFVITVFCWFNYNALGAMRGVYQNMGQLKQNFDKKEEFKVEDTKKMMEEFE